MSPFSYSSPSSLRVIPIAAKVAAAMAQTVRLNTQPPLSLYIHFPWCVRKCPYCDFNSHAVREGGIPEALYIDALLKDLELALPEVWGRRIVSVFIGGGTPSLISATGLDRLLTAVRSLLPLIPGAEVTLEANPGTIEADRPSARFADFRQAGVTRLSLGVQSFDDARLQGLGRIHNSREARTTIELAARHFETWNIDLMYALPQQTLQAAQKDLETALSYAPPHLSCYHLTLEPNTLFYRQRPVLPDEDLSADMQDMIESLLELAGYQHYETSAFARSGHRCQHNLNYWGFGDYLGIGAGAHSKLSRHDNIVRQMRHKHPQSYLAAMESSSSFIQEQHVVSAADIPFEFMMNVLRLLKGVPREQFQATTGLPLELIEAQLIQARGKGLLHVDAKRIQPTEQGRRFLNDLLEIFLINSSEK